MSAVCLFRCWRLVSSATENGSWPHWETGYTKTPHRNLHGPSPSGWVSEQAAPGTKQHLKRSGFESWLHQTREETVVLSQMVVYFSWRGDPISVTTQLITQISQEGTTHSFCLPECSQGTGVIFSPSFLILSCPHKGSTALDVFWPLEIIYWWDSDAHLLISAGPNSQNCLLCLNMSLRRCFIWATSEKKSQ